MKNLGRIITLVGLLIVLLIPFGVSAQGSQPATLSINVDKVSASLVEGEWVNFQTEITNTGETVSPPLVAHLNVASLQPGKHVDPEDWSPERTQYLPPIQPGETVLLDWRVHTLFEGNFAVFVSLVSEDATFTTLSSPALQIRATPDAVLPMKDVIPTVAAVPFFPLGLLVFTKVLGRKKI